ncbi:hypothetical protein NZK35_11485 [Stieleria sp. ICT_E10.1]|uniref:hypothetical protein n=1 Tax=Stieleria sedimenti TaxID=2976331 RepID=UPI002180781E|nr:hypothetical protein [Stieleria sedimenti]MCS7467265.1 hypothetical protein [Stieleria sedimenti]
MAIVAVAVIEAALCFVDIPFDASRIFLPRDRPPTVVETIMETKLQAANSIGNAPDVLLLGDSSGLMGLDPRVMSGRVGKDVFNLCSISLIGADGQRAILERYIRTHGRPSVIVYHYAPHDLRYTADDLANWKFRQSVYLWLAASDGQAVEAESYRRDEFRVLPSQRFRDAVQRRLFFVFDRPQNLNTPRGRFGSHHEMVEQVLNQDGFMQEVNEDETDEPRDLNLAMPESQEAALDALLDYVDRIGVPIFLVSNPLPAYAKTDATLESLRRQQQQLQQIMARHEQAAILLPEQRFLPRESFATLNHLRPSAAAQNSKEIADLIKGGGLIHE